MFKKVLTIALAFIMLLSVTVTSFGAEVAEPTITAEGAIVYCENTGEIVYSKNMDKQYCPYSITKVLTALLAVQNLPLDQEVTVSAAAASQGGSTMNLVEGEKITVQDLLYGAMLVSGNDATYALAEAVYGDIDTFLKLMNDTARNIGCKNTNFTSVNGLDNKTNLTTAYDMMQIIRVAFSNDILKGIAGSKTYTVAATNKSEERQLKTHIDEIKDSDSGVYSAKTGYWDDNNSSLVIGYQKNGLSLYIVLLDDVSKERSTDITALIDYTTKKVQGAKVIGKDKAAGKVRIKHGAKTRLETYTLNVGYAYVPKEGSDSLISTNVVMNDDVTAPVKKGDVVGTYQIFVAGEMVNEVPLIIKEDVEEGWFPSYIGISNFMTIVIGVALTVIILLVLIILVLRCKNKRKRKRLREKKLLEIARIEAELEQERAERDWTF